MHSHWQGCIQDFSKGVSRFSSELLMQGSGVQPQLLTDFARQMLQNLLSINICLIQVLAIDYGYSGVLYSK